MFNHRRQGYNKRGKDNGAENFLELMKNKPTDLKAPQIQRKITL